MPEEYELQPRHARAKSFYGKARVRLDDFRNQGLISYGTPVCWYDPNERKLHRLWDRWSATTGRHIDEFARQTLGAAVGKNEWDAMEVEPLPPFLRP